MAMVSMLFIMLIVYVAIVLGIGFIGLVILIVSLIRRSKKKREGKKPGKVGIIIGSILLAVPILHVVFIVGSILTTSITNKIERADYTCLTDEWRNGWVTDDEAKDDAIEELLTAADKGDRDRLMDMFPQNVNETRLEKQIDNFLNKYPKGLSECERKTRHSSATGEEFSVGYEIQMDGEWYYIELDAKYQQEDDDNDKDDSDEVGVTLFTVESEKSYVLDKEYGKRDYIIADIETDDDFETRRVSSQPYIFTPMDREITEDEVLRTLKHERSIESFIKKYGEPNSVKSYSNSNGTDYIYELVPDNNEPRYLRIDAVGDKIIIDSCHISGEEESDHEIWLDDDGEPRED